MLLHACCTVLRTCRLYCHSDLNLCTVLFVVDVLLICKAGKHLHGDTKRCYAQLALTVCWQAAATAVAAARSWKLIPY